MPKIVKKQKEKETPKYEDLVQLIESKPEDSVVVTYSELDAFRQCPLKHQWSYVDKYRQDAVAGTALTRGSLWHQVMESHYLLLQKHPQWEEYTKERFMQFMLQHFLTDDAGNSSEDQQLIEWMYSGYLEMYGPDSQWEPVLVEQAGEVPMLQPDGSPSGFYLRFKIDMVARDRTTGALWLFDHKSASTFGRDTEIELDDQFRLYTWALRQMGVPVHGIVRSDARTKRNKGPMSLDNRFRRVITYCTDTEANNVAADALEAARAAYLPGRPVYPSPAPDRCSWRCNYREPCIARRRGLGTPEQLMKDFRFRQSSDKHREYALDPVAEGIRGGVLDLA